MKKKTFFRLTVFLLIITVVICELFLRIAFVEQLKTQSFPLIYEPDSLGGYKYVPFAKNVHIAPSYSITEQKSQIVNSHGYFGPDFKKNKNMDTFRIAIFGYSFTSGGDILNYIQKKFKQNNRKVEVINCSVDGANNNWHMYKQIMHEVPNYNIDLVLFETSVPFQRQDYTRECYRNYVLEYNPYVKESRKYCTDRIDRICNSKLLTLLYDKSYIVRSICKVLVDKNEYVFGSFTQQYIAPYRKKKILSDDRIMYKYTFEKTIMLLQLLDINLKEKNSKLLILNYYKTPYNERRVEPLLMANQIGYVNLGITAEYYDQNLRLELDGHPSENGYKYIADCLYNSLLSGKHIPNNY